MRAAPRLVAIPFLACALTACGDPTPSEPADPATLARLLSSGFGNVPGLMSSPVFSTAPLIDGPRLCGPKGKDFGTLRVSFQDVEVLERQGIDLYTVKAKGRCTIDGATGYRPVSGRFRIHAKASVVVTQKARRWKPAKGFFTWSLEKYTLLEADPPGAWVEQTPAPPPPHCPESITQAASQSATCNPRIRTICWFGEVGCQCNMMGLPWKCGLGGCPSPRPEVGAPCKDPLVRCLPAAGSDASDSDARGLTCVDGRWIVAKESP